MNSIEVISNSLARGKKLYEEKKEDKNCSVFSVKETYGMSRESEIPSGRIAAGDNLEYMVYLIKKMNMSGRLQVIYADPPFFTKNRYQASFKLTSDRLGKSGLIKIGAYDDLFDRNLGDYLTMLAACFFAMRELLSETGCIWVHIDWHVSHYVRLMLDQIFGEENFINEIIWTYKSGGTGKKSFARKHDTIYLYSKSGGYMFNPLKEKSYNRGLKPYRFKDVKEFEDEKGWYTMVNMKDVWNIDMVGRTSSERTGYATQKPEKLMERIIASCSSEGDLCADFFAGSGTFGAVCGKMNRSWIMCDVGDVAVSSQIMRLAGSGNSFCVERQSSTAVDSGSIKCTLYEKKLILEDYEVNTDKIECSDAEEVLKYIRDDSLNLIKFWSVDFSFDGNVHRTEKICSSGVWETVCDGIGKTEKISVVAYDFFGKRMSCLICGS